MLAISKQKLWLTRIGYLAYDVDSELYKAIDYLKARGSMLLAGAR